MFTRSHGHLIRGIRSALARPLPRHRPRALAAPYGRREGRRAVAAALTAAATLGLGIAGVGSAHADAPLHAVVLHGGAHGETSLMVTHDVPSLINLGFDDAATLDTAYDEVGQTLSFYSGTNYTGDCYQVDVTRDPQVNLFPDSVAGKVSSLAFGLPCGQDPGRLYAFRSVLAFTGKPSQVLDVPGGKSDWGTGIEAWSRNSAGSDSDNQNWYFKQEGTIDIASTTQSRGFYQDGAPVYKIEYVPNRNWAAATCLELPGATPFTSNAEEYGCDPNSFNQPNQLWVVVRSDLVGNYPGGVVLQNLATGLGVGHPVLSVADTVAPWNGTHLRMADIDSSISPPDTQMFTMFESSADAPTGGGGGGGRTCVGYGCLINL